jgi:D-galactarolactone cycloisomerase
MSRGTAIRSVTAHRLTATLKEPFAYSQAWYASRTAMLVEIATEDGVTGWGEAFGPAAITASVVEWLAPLLIGQDATATERHWQRMYNALRDHGQKGVAIEAISAVDTALWDIRGRLAGLPVHRLLGGPIRTEVRAYATGLYRRDRPDHEAYLREEAADYAAQGFSAMKLKTGWGVAEDVALTRALRSEIGEGIALAADANHAYDATAAAAYLRGAAGMNLMWFEEPVPPEDIEGYVELRRLGLAPIAGGEAEFTRWGHRRLLEARAVDILQPDLAAAGGISETKKIADMAAAFGIRCNPHVWGTGVAMAASLQLVAVLPHTPPGLFPAEPLLEFDRSEHPLRDAVLREPIRHERGLVRVPDGPGLGVELDRAALDRYRM